MPHFVHDGNRYFLSTSMKVMYSTLKAQTALRRATGRELRRHACSQHFPLVRARRHFVIVRDPFARLVSFYRDKFLQDPALRGPFAYDDWQDCQRLFFPLLGIRRDEAPGSIAERLRSVTLAELLEMLPSCYRDDAHVAPQSDVRWVPVAGRRLLTLRFDRVLRLESAEDLAALSRLGIDTSIRAQSTAEVSFTPRWSTAQRELVVRLYADDFERFGYAPRPPP